MICVKGKRQYRGDDHPMWTRGIPMVLYSYVLNGYVVEEVIGRGALDHRSWGRGGVPTHLPLDYGRQNSST
jgi:hypothetical protein